MSTTLDTEHSLPVYSPICAFCRHWDLSKSGRYCTAYPDGQGIPLPIWTGLNDHTHPYPGDHGIRFTPVKESTDGQEG